jgi:hypothetical protein
MEKIVQKKLLSCKRNHRKDADTNKSFFLGFSIIRDPKLKFEA